jgi:hypothetical protein
MSSLRRLREIAYVHVRGIVRCDRRGGFGSFGLVCCTRAHTTARKCTCLYDSPGGYHVRQIRYTRLKRVRSRSLWVCHVIKQRDAAEIAPHYTTSPGFTLLFRFPYTNIEGKQILATYHYYATDPGYSKGLHQADCIDRAHKFQPSYMSRSSHG